MTKSLLEKKEYRNKLQIIIALISTICNVHGYKGIIEKINRKPLK